MDYQTLLFELQDTGVALLTLNRPEALNAIDEQLARKWRDALDRCAEDAGIRCVVITGAGRAFCAGQDVKNLRGRTDVGSVLRDWYDPIIMRIRGLRKPVIAAVNGVAVGAGCNLALCCDLRFAAETARFGQVFVNIGVLPDSGGFFYLPRLVGWGKATELMLSGDIINAREAERIGMINGVIPPDELLPQTLAYAAKLAAGPTAVFGMIKDGLDKSVTSDLAASLAFEIEWQDRATSMADFHEGVAAFLEKRAARFSGR